MQQTNSVYSFHRRRRSPATLSTQKMAPGKVIVSLSLVRLRIDVLSCNKKTRNKQRPTTSTLLDVVEVRVSKATLPTQKNGSKQSRRLVFSFSLVGVDDLSCNNKKRNKQKPTPLFNVVGLGARLRLFPPKKWHLAK